MRFFIVWEQIKKNLTRQKDFFSDIKVGKKPETVPDSEGEFDNTVFSKYKKGQNVEFL